MKHLHSVLLTVVASLVGVSTLVAVADSAKVGSVQCAQLNPGSQATLRMILPRQWKLERTAVVVARSRIRAHDGAPVSYVAVRLRDAEARLVSTPAVWVWEGGTELEHDKWPKRIMNLNDAAVAAVNAGYTYTADGTLANARRRIPDARLLSKNPYDPADPEVEALVACLN